MFTLTKYPSRRAFFGSMNPLPAFVTLTIRVFNGGRACRKAASLLAGTSVWEPNIASCRIQERFSMNPYFSASITDPLFPKRSSSDCTVGTDLVGSQQKDLNDQLIPHLHQSKTQLSPCGKQKGEPYWVRKWKAEGFVAPSVISLWPARN